MSVKQKMTTTFFQVVPKICDKRISVRLGIIPFRSMSSNLSASDMQYKANEQGPTGRGFLLRDGTGRVLAKKVG